jgi:hypothetical protein
VVHPDQIVVDRLRDADAGQVVARRAGPLGELVGRVRRVVAADVEEVARPERRERRQRLIDSVAGQFVAARSQDAGGRLAEGVQEAGRLGPQIDGLAGEQPFDAVPEPDDPADGVAGLQRRLDDPEQRAIDDGGRPAGLADDERPVG